MILHKVSTSPYTDLALAQCLKLLGPQDGLILLQDAVYALTHLPSQQPLAGLLKNTRLYVLSADLQARGISAEFILTQAELVNYQGFVGLTLEYNQLMSW